MLRCGLYTRWEHSSLASLALLCRLYTQRSNVPAPRAKLAVLNPTAPNDRQMQQLLSRTPFYQSAPCKCEMRGVSLRDLQLRATGHNRRVSWVSTSQCTLGIGCLSVRRSPWMARASPLLGSEKPELVLRIPSSCCPAAREEIPRVPATLAKRMRRGAVLSTAPRLLPNPASRWKICDACYTISRDSATS